MEKLLIKEASKQDLEAMLELVKELAIYEDMEDELKASQKDYEKNIFEEGYAKALVLFIDGKMIGYAIYFFTFSSFLGHGGLYLEDLYIQPNFRKKGYGKAVFKYLAQICKEKNLKRLEWVCLHENQLGIDFYTSLKAQNLSKTWRTYRLDGANLQKLSDE